MFEGRFIEGPGVPAMRIAGRTVHTVGMPYRFGSQGFLRGDAANELLAISEELYVHVMETKALVCNIKPGRRGPAHEPEKERSA